MNFANKPALKMDFIAGAKSVLKHIGKRTANAERKNIRNAVVLIGIELLVFLDRGAWIAEAFTHLRSMIYTTSTRKQKTKN